MNPGAFSVSLAVKDIAASRKFYETLGFEVFGGKQEDNWLIMKCGDTLIGLFQGMFDANLLTFNPGWDSNAAALDEFTDVHTIQSALLSEGYRAGEPVGEPGSGPRSFTVEDPDGNTILFDQHR